MPTLSTAEQALLLSTIALILSGVNFWFSHLKRGKPRFVCFAYTALGMQHSDGKPRAAFAVKLRVINNGKVPLTLIDLLLVARHNKGDEAIRYHPVFLFDFQQYFEHQKEPDTMKYCLKGAVSLPIVIPPEDSFEFPTHILFLPLETDEMIQPLRQESAQMRIYARTDRASKYKPIAEQVFQVNDIKDLKMGGYSGVISDVSLSGRKKFFDNFEW